MEDTKKTLEQLQRELINEDSRRLDALLEEFLEEPLPAFEEPDTTVAAEQPVTYRNYSNNYGQPPPVPKSEIRQQRQRQRDDRTLVGLMILASAECVGILAMLVYWLKIFL